MQETRVRSLGRDDLLEKERQPTPAFLPGESHGQRSLAGYSSWVCKESDTTQQWSACACTRVHTHTDTDTHTLFIVNEVKPKTLHGIL